MFIHLNTTDGFPREVNYHFPDYHFYVRRLSYMFVRDTHVSAIWTSAIVLLMDVLSKGVLKSGTVSNPQKVYQRTRTANARISKAVLNVSLCG